MADWGLENKEVQGWIESVLSYRERDPQLTMTYCDKLIAYADAHQNDRVRGFAYYYKAEDCYVLNDADSFFRYITKALSYLVSTEQWDLVARSYNITAIASMNRGNAPYAMDYYLNALSYCDKYKIDDVGIMVKINIGMLYHTFGNEIQAQKYFENSLQKILQKGDFPRRDGILFSAYLGLSNSFLCRDQLGKADEYAKKAQEICVKINEPLYELCMCCLQARICQQEGKTKARNEMVQRACELLGEDIPLLDVFDDLYDLGKMLLEIGNDEILWKILYLLDQLSKQAKITNLQKKILSLKIKYYKKNGNSAEFLQAAGLYYEMTEKMESENTHVIGKMLDVRSILEESNKQRRQMEEENKELHYQSETDALTGIANRFYLNRYAERMFAKALEEQTSVAIEILDIDYFKQYNDNYGHQAGDTCIYKVARAIKQLSEHENVFVARYGGDEFVVIYTGYTKNAVESMMEDLKKKIQALDIEHRYSKAAPIVTISQGASYGIPREGDRVWDFLHAADAMLYRVKEVSRNSLYLSEYEGS